MVQKNRGSDIHYIKTTRKFSGKAYYFISEDFDTRNHALRWVPDWYLKRHHIKFTIQANGFWRMWGRPVRKGEKATTPDW